jgi:S-adenosyl methyltransferase
MQDHRCDGMETVLSGSYAPYQEWRTGPADRVGRRWPVSAGSGVERGFPGAGRVPGGFAAGGVPAGGAGRGGRDGGGVPRPRPQVAAAYPDIRVAVRAQRAFLARAAHFLVTQAGIRQFPDIGTGLPSANNTH